MVNSLTNGSHSLRVKTPKNRNDRHNKRSIKKNKKGGSPKIKKNQTKN